MAAKSTYEFGKSVVPEWSPQPDWIDISSVADNEINLLVCDWGVSAIGLACTIAAAGTYSIDWGDGTVETGRASTTTYTHTYTVGTGTACSLGYTTFKVRIYGATGNITAFAMKQNADASTQTPQASTVLWAVFGTTALTTVANAFYSTTVYCQLLQSVTFPATMNSLSSMANCFLSCTGLRHIEMPTSATGITTLAASFQSCLALRSIRLPPIMNSLTDMTSTFYECRDLVRVVMPTSADTLSLINATFYGCTALESLDFPTDITTITTFVSAFTGCYRIRSIVLPTTLNSLTSMSSMCYNCMSLEEITMPTSMTGLTTLAQAFYQCMNLYTVSLPTTLASLTTMASTFAYCYLLADITLPTANSLATMTSTFLNCRGLLTVTLPATLGAVTDASTCFSGCYSLNTITNLSGLGKTTTAGCNGTDFLFGCQMLTTISLAAWWSKISCYGASGKLNKVTSLRLTNASSTFAGASAQVDVRYCDLGAAALDTLFGDLPTLVGKTINITGCTGSATSTKTLASDKGWTVVG